MSRPLPPDETQIAVYRRHGDIKAAAAEIGLPVTTFRCRLIRWGIHKPNSAPCVVCGRLSRTGAELCYVCRKRQEKKKRRELRAAAVPTKTERGESVPARYPDCSRYGGCLDRAAKQRRWMKCEGCPDYDAVGF